MKSMFFWPKENSWAELRRCVQARRPPNLTQPHQFCPANFCENPEKGKPKCLMAMLLKTKEMPVNI